ncbi:putative toxin-antitoxin system toxin component, PIN family [Mucilaginibacter sp.]|uniref:putative toxin-antitoxin system toxin component, PIN family n=1 Tax=Mucilaginibacter sp. TaxID=1882438 RepID=UPI00285230A0|nr:putative toxin-antitoxin system toxin component, PIN family [Mucilaginibacter sp.]MDR3697024.1 putative toxin-antitoxin system toxin component, PIN family [Mucilaginibacter sp.]
MRTQKNRVIIDTNLWISFLLTKDFSTFDKIVAANKLTLIFSQELVDEFVEVTQRDKFRKYFPLKDVENLLLKIKNRAMFINVTSNVSICRDIKDNFLLALAMDSNATHLITGDKDLLVLEKFVNTKILTMAEYLMSQ